jgi:lysophospholipase L1-like esterase
MTTDSRERTLADLRICFVGDSFTQGTGDETYLGWPGRVCAAARARGHTVTAYNLGIRRETTADILARWKAEVTPRLVPGVDGRVVFSFGANDATQEDGRWRVAPDQSAANARAMISEAKAAYPVLVIGPPPAPEADKTARHAELAARYAEVCRELDVPFLDILPSIQPVEAWWQEVAAGDGIHPGSGGYAALAGLVEQWAAWKAWLP